MGSRIDDAIALQRVGQYAQAQALYEELLRDDPRNALLLNLLGVVLFRQGKLDMAIAHLEEAVRIRPADHDARFNLACAYQTAERHDEAIKAFRLVLEGRPDHATARARLGSSLQIAGDLGGGIRHLAEACAQAPTGENLLSLGGALHSCGRLVEAVEAYRTGIETEKNNPNAYGLYGRALLGLARLDEAEAAFDAALALAPADQQALRGRERCGIYRALVARRDGPDGLAVRGSLSGPSGYAHMSRCFVHHLRAQGVAVQAIGLYGREPWQPPDADDRPEAMVHLDDPVRARGVLNFLIPAMVEPAPGLRTVTFSMFEGPRVPGYWAEVNRHHDLVIVPTVSSREAWAAAGYPEERVRVCPLGVDPGLDPATVESLAMLAPGGRPVDSFRTRILNVSDFIPRKNIDGLLRVWLTATTAADDAVLIIKVGKGNASQIREIQRIVERTQEAVGRRLDQAAPIVVLNMRFSDEQMTALFATATHYWSMSHGEGWDLPMTQAGAMGRQLIAPDHSAYRDYLDPSVAWMIPSSTTPALKPYSQEPWAPFFGLEWWRPDEAYAADLIRRIVRAEEPPRHGARERLRNHFTWEQSTRTLIGQLREVGAL